MSLPSSDPGALASIRLARQVDECCDRFEAQWVCGPPPVIEEFLSAVEGTRPPRLLEELLVLDAFYRQRGGEIPLVGDYLLRFPQLPAATIEELVDRGVGQPTRRGSSAEDASTIGQQPGFPERRPRLRYFGDYELLVQIARGGMGVVYKARQVSLNRLVAVKMILAGQFASEAQVKRFYSEAESAAQLDHPNIVSIYEVGEHNGDHYFSMALVEGTSLAAQLATGPSEPRQAAEVVQQVALAIEYAHGRGVIHRDLKPSNILIDTDGRPRVTDFGLAKRVSDVDGLTLTGEVLGTPSYMPPEQAAGKIDVIGPTADVYALGAVLYALLAGRPPFQAASSVDTLRQVVDQEPVRLRQLNSAIPRDLETITLKCLEKSVARRFVTAKHLAEELQRFLEGRPIQARPVGRLERGWRWCRRNPIVALLIVGIFLSQTIGAIAAGLFAKGENSQRRIAEAATLEAQTEKKIADKQTLLAQNRERDALLALERAEQQHKLAEQSWNAESAARQQVEQRTREALWSLYVARLYALVPAWKEQDIGNLERQLSNIKNTENSQSNYRGWEWYYLQDQCRQAVTALKCDSGFSALAWAPSGTRLATCSNSGEVSIYERIDLSRPKQVVANGANAICWNRDGTQLAIATKSDEILIFNAITIERISSFQGPATENGSKLTWSADGTCFTRNGVGWLQVLDAKGALLWKFSLDEFHENVCVHNCAWHPNKLQVAVTTHDAILRVYDVEHGELLWHKTVGNLHSHAVQWSHDGAKLAVSGGWPNFKAFIFDNDGNELRQLQGGHSHYLTGLSWSPDDQQLVTCSLDQRSIIWNMDGSIARAVNLHSVPIWRVSWSPLGTEIVSLSDDGVIRLWPAIAQSNASRLLGRHKGEVHCLAWNPQGSQILTSGADGTIRTWDITRGVQTAQWNHHSYSVAWHPDGATIAAAGSAGTLKFWGLAGNKAFPDQRVGSAGFQVSSLDWSPQGKWLACGSGETRTPQPEIRIWRWNDGPGEAFSLCSRYRGSCAWSPNGRYLAVVSTGDSLVAIFDVEKRKEVARVQGTSGAHRVRWSVDGNLIATCHSDGTITVRRATDLKQVVFLRGHEGAVECVAWSPDGQRLASASGSGAIKIWDSSTGDELLELMADASVKYLAWSPSGTRLATGQSDGAIRLWEIDPGEHLLPTEGLATGKLASADGQENPYADVVNSSRLIAQRILRIGGVVVVAGQATRKIEELIVDDASIDEVRLPNCDVEGHTIEQLQALPALRTLELFGATVSEEAFVRLASMRGLRKLVLDQARFAPEAIRHLHRMQWLRELSLADAVVPAKALTELRTELTNVRINGSPAWSGAIDEQLKLTGPTAPVYGVAITPDGKQAVSISDDWDIRVYDLTTGKLQRKIHTIGGLRGLKVAADCRSAVIGGSDGEVQQWSLETGKLLNQFRGHKNGIERVDISSDGTFVAADGDKFCLVWNAKTGHVVQRFEAHRGEPTTVTFAPNGQHVVSGSRNDSFLSLWDVESGKTIAKFSPVPAWPMMVVFTNDGRRLIAALSDGSVQVWDVASTELLHRWKDSDDAFQSASLGYGDRVVASGGYDGIVRVWDLATGRRKARVQIENLGAVFVAAEPTGERLLVGGGWRWDASLGRVVSADYKLRVLKVTDGSPATKNP